jgi:hypothetical protein
MLRSPRGPSKRYINLVIWYRPRVNNLHCLCLSFHFLHILPSLPSSLQHLLASLVVLCNRKYPSGSSSCQNQLQLYLRLRRLQLSSTNYKFNCFLFFRTSQTSIFIYQFSSSIVNELPDFSGYNCFLRFSNLNGLTFWTFIHLFISSKKFIVN